MHTRTLLTVAALLALTGCSSHDTATSTHAAASSSTPAAPTDPYERYAAADERAGTPVKIQRSDALGVANATCYSDADHMLSLVQLIQSEYSGTELQDGLINYANLIDAYCPDARAVFDAATRQTVGKVIPATH